MASAPISPNRLVATSMRKNRRYAMTLNDIQVMTIANTPRPFIFHAVRRESKSIDLFSERKLCGSTTSIRIRVFSR